MELPVDTLGAGWRLGGIGEGCAFGVGVACWCMNEAQVCANLSVKEVEAVGTAVGGFAGDSLEAGAVGGFGAIVGKGVLVDVARRFGVGDAAALTLICGAMVLVAVGVAESVGVGEVVGGMGVGDGGAGGKGVETASGALVEGMGVEAVLGGAAWDR